MVSNNQPRAASLGGPPPSSFPKVEGTGVPARRTDPGVASGRRTHVLMSAGPFPVSPVTPFGSRGPHVVVGLDLAGAPTRSTGFCVLRGPSSLETAVLHSDEEILSAVERVRPALVVIDAPLSLPRGRSTIEDRAGPHLRACDRELLRRGIRFFPLTLGPMRLLTVRGIRLRTELEARGLRVLEGYPGGSQDLLGLPRKQAGVARLQRALRRRGLRGDLLRRVLSHDELDAVTIAWVGRMHLRGRGLLIGDPSEGEMLLPRPSVAHPRANPHATRRLRGRRRPLPSRPKPRSRSQAERTGAVCSGRIVPLAGGREHPRT